MNYAPEELSAGLITEFEHTDDPHEALTIAMEHLDEEDDFYTREGLAHGATIEDLAEAYEDDEDEIPDWVKMLGAFAVGAGMVGLIVYLTQDK